MTSPDPSDNVRRRATATASEASAADVSPALARGRYRLVSILGQGTQATVYRAWDQRLGVWRAVKVLRPGGSRALRDRFEAEARTLARLKDPSLMVVHDVGEEGERAYMVMDLAAESLEDRLVREGPLEPVDACAIAAAVAAGLVAAHAAGVVHRDIKPENVLADPTGRPVLSDFGIARVVDERRTRADTTMGTPQFMPPEQRRGAETVDARADIYALGATLYTTIVGHEPSGPIEELVTEVALARVPEPLHEVLRRATARDPDRRYGTATAFRAALLQAQARLGAATRRPWVPPRVGTEPPETDPHATVIYDQGSPTTGVGDTTETGPPLSVVAPTSIPSTRSRPLLPWLIAGALVALGVAAAGAAAVVLVGAGTAWWASGQLAYAPRIGPLRPLTTYPPGVPLEVFGLTADGSAVLYLDGATGLVWRHPVDGSTPRARLHPDVDEPRLAGYLAEDLLAFVGDDGHLALRDLRVGRDVPFDHDGFVFEASPSGDQVAWHDGRAAYRAGVDGSPAVPVLSVPDGQQIHGIAWSPSEDALAFVVIGERKAGDAQLRVIVADANGMMASRPVYTSGAIAYTDQLAPIAWPWPDALVVAEGIDGEEHLVVVPVDGDEPEHLAPMPIHVGYLSARGGSLAVLGVREVEDTWVANVAAGRLVETHPAWADEDVDGPVDWLPTGELAFASDRFQRRRLLAQRPDGDDTRVLAEDPGACLAGDGLARLLDDGTLDRGPLPGPTDPPWAPEPPVTRWDRLVCAADGSCVAARYLADGLDIVRFAPGESAGVRLGRLPTTRLVDIALSTDARALAVMERTGGSTVVRWCDVRDCAWTEVPVQALDNAVAIAWRTDAAGWWIATAASKSGASAVVASVRLDGAVAASNAVDGWTSVLRPSPDGAQLAFGVHRRDMDVWVADVRR